MGAGGWNLVHMWLTDGIVAKNWALIQELLELLLLCPVDIERLKSNNCPKLIKGLSKEGSHQGVRVLASRLVEQWLKIVKGEAPPNSIPAQIMTLPGSSKPCVIPTAIVHPRPANVISTTQISFSEKTETDKNAQLAQSNSLAVDETHAIKQIEHQHQQQQSNESQYQQIAGKATSVQPVQLPIVTSSAQAPCQPSQLQKKQSYVVLPSAQTSSAGGGPVYKITIRDGNRVLTKLETDAAHINNVIDFPSNEISGESTNDALQSQDSRQVAADGEGGSSSSTQKADNLLPIKSGAKVTDETPIEPTDRDPSEIIPVISSKDNCETDNLSVKDNKDERLVSDSNKSVSDKENRDSSKRESDKKSSGTSSGSSSSSSTDKKSSHHGSSSSSKSSSKHSSKESSNSHRSGSNSHRSSAHRSTSSKSTTSKEKTKDKDKDNKDKHHSSSSSSKHGSSNKSRSERDKEREKEKEKLKKDQAEKDKATLEKVQGPALSFKLGKIPKKKSEDDKANDGLTKRSSIDSKESKDKIDAKKAAAVSAVSEKKSISMSIENRKASQDSTTRPKTVKTFNSKFRSTGLEEEAKPPPPRSVKKPNQVPDKKIIPPKLSSLKRASPLRETSSSADKRARLSLDSPVTPPADEKKGGIKLIPPKPKRKYRLVILDVLSNQSAKKYIYIGVFFFHKRKEVNMNKSE